MSRRSGPRAGRSTESDAGLLSFSGRVVRGSVAAQPAFLGAALVTVLRRPPPSSVERWRPGRVGAGPRDLEESGLPGDHLDGVPEPNGGLPDRGWRDHRSLEAVRWVAAHDDRRRLSLGPAERVGDLHRLHDRRVPLLVV